MLKLPRVISHRGTAGYAPENTLDGIHTAADMGIKWVELDVKLTKDFVPIIFHDDTLDRTTNGSGKVAEMTFDEINQYECGSYFSDGFAGTKIPSLEQAIEALIDRDLGFNMEIKACPGRETDTAAVALDMLSTVWDDHDKLLISSFSHTSLETAMDMAADWRRGLLIGDASPDVWVKEMSDEFLLPSNWKEVCDYLDATTINISQKLAHSRNIADIRDYDKPVLVYTIDDPMVAHELSRLGVDSMFSNAPDIIEEQLLSLVQ